MSPETAPRLEHNWLAGLPSALRGRLRADAADEVAAYVLRQRGEGGCFHGRDGEADAYYTVFGVECLLWLGRIGELAPTRACIMDSMSAAADDFVHHACLARCRHRLGVAAEPPRTLEAWRTNDGGFHRGPERDRLSVYDTFLAWMAGVELVPSPPLLVALKGAGREEGSFAGGRNDNAGAVPPTAAALMLLQHLGAQPPASTRVYLKACCAEEGGWRATPDAPGADLLSTATALHALCAWGATIPKARATEDFVLSLFDDSGGFRGSALDSTPDVEYTFYGLLALACLASAAGQA